MNTEFYLKPKKAFASKLQEAEEEVEPRGVNVEKELAKALQEHNAREEAIRKQHDLHMAETMTRKKACAEN